MYADNSERSREAHCRNSVRVPFWWCIVIFEMWSPDRNRLVGFARETFISFRRDWYCSYIDTSSPDWKSQFGGYSDQVSSTYSYLAAMHISGARTLRIFDAGFESLTMSVMLVCQSTGIRSFLETFVANINKNDRASLQKLHHARLARHATRYVHCQFTNSCVA